MEKWSIISAAPKYSISNKGQLKRNAYSIQCIGVAGLETRYYPEKIRKLFLKSNDYVRVVLNQKNFYMHRLVFETFSNKKIPEGFEINHIDGNKHNNSFENLVLVTRSENSFHAISLNLRKVKLSEVEKRTLLFFYNPKKGIVKILSKIFKVSSQTVHYHVKKAALFG